MPLQLKQAVNSLFNRMGEVATYQGQEILYLLSAPDEVIGIGFAKAQTSTAKLQIRISDAPNLQIGDEIIGETRTFRISTEPMKDIHNLIWTIDLCI